MGSAGPWQWNWNPKDTEEAVSAKAQLGRPLDCPRGRRKSTGLIVECQRKGWMEMAGKGGGGRSCRAFQVRE
jgi:hypothetical protein